MEFVRLAAAEAESMGKQRWEYSIVTSRDDLHRLGEEGWELIQVAVAGGLETFYMKRPAPSIREEITAAQRERVVGKSAERGEES